MSPRTGRPKTGNPKAIRYSVRLDAETEARLVDYAKEHSISKGEAIRKAIHLLLSKRKRRSEAPEEKPPLPTTNE